MNRLESILPFLGYSDASTAIPMWILLVLSVALDFVLSESLLFRGAEPATFRRMRFATYAMFLLLMLKALCGIYFGLSAFGMMLLAWYTLVLVVPVVGMRLFLSVRKHPERRVVRLLAVCAMLSLLLTLYARFVEPYHLRVDRAQVTVDSLPTLARPLRIGVLADLQCESIGEHERAAVQRLMQEAPDMILIPGDLLQGGSQLFERWLPDLRELLQGLQAPAGVFMVVGDVDGSQRCQLVARGTHLRVLVNEVVELEIRGQRVRLLGLATMHAENLFTSSGRKRSSLPESLRVLEAFATEREPDCLRILLAHHPRMTNHLPEDHAVQLSIAGHTHGGQICLPLIGPPITASPLPRTIAAGGLHDYNGVQLYISRGVGLERDQAPRIRFGCRPEVGLLEVWGQGG